MSRTTSSGPDIDRKQARDRRKRTDDEVKRHFHLHKFKGLEYRVANAPLFMPINAETPPVVVAMWTYLCVLSLTIGWFACSLFGYHLCRMWRNVPAPGEGANLDFIFTAQPLNRWAVNLVVSFGMLLFFTSQALWFVWYRLLNNRGRQKEDAKNNDYIDLEGRAEKHKKYKQSSSNIMMQEPDISGLRSNRHRTTPDSQMNGETYGSPASMVPAYQPYKPERRRGRETELDSRYRKEHTSRSDHPGPTAHDFSSRHPPGAAGFPGDRLTQPPGIPVPHGNPTKESTSSSKPGSSKPRPHTDHTSQAPDAAALTPAQLAIAQAQAQARGRGAGTGAVPDPKPAKPFDPRKAITGGRPGGTVTRTPYGTLKDHELKAGRSMFAK